MRTLVVISAVLALIFGLFPVSHGNAHAVAAIHADCHHADPHASERPDDRAVSVVDHDDCGKHGLGGCMDANGCRHASCDVAGVPLPSPLPKRVYVRAGNSVLADDTVSGLTIPPLLDPPRPLA